MRVSLCALFDVYFMTMRFNCLSAKYVLSSATEQGAAPDCLQPCVPLVPRFTSGFRQPVSLLVSPMNNLESVVDDYIRDHRNNAEREQRWFAIQPSLPKAVEVSALAKSPSGKRLSHQRRIPSRVLEESCRRLLQKLSVLEASRSFEELFEVVASAIRPIPGIGELAVYDTTLRIGAYLRLEPTKVFLHAGTRTGAHRLGLDASQEFLEVSRLPAELRALKPQEIEDVLCIYKHRLQGAARG